MTWQPNNPLGLEPFDDDEPWIVWSEPASGPPSGGGGVTLLDPSCTCYECDPGDCCDQGPAIEITLSGGTGCWAEINGTFALTLEDGSDCISFYSEWIPVGLGPCTTDYCVSELRAFGRTAYWIVTRLFIRVIPEGIAGGIRVEVSLQLDAYEQTSSCVLFIEGGNLQSFPVVVFTGDVCRPTLWDKFVTGPSLFGDAPDLDTLEF